MVGTGPVSASLLVSNFVFGHNFHKPSFLLSFKISLTTLLDPTIKSKVLLFFFLLINTLHPLAFAIAELAAAPAAPAKAPAASANGARPYPGRELKQGAPAGPDVLYLQNKLGVTPPGPFGPKTHTAVVALQKKNGLTADGIVGPLTWSKLG